MFQDKKILAFTDCESEDFPKKIGKHFGNISVTEEILPSSDILENPEKDFIYYFGQISKMKISNVRE